MEGECGGLVLTLWTRDERLFSRTASFRAGALGRGEKPQERKRIQIRRTVPGTRESIESTRAGRRDLGHAVPKQVNELRGRADGLRAAVQITQAVVLRKNSRDD
jgi:hypothetical protein